MASCALPEIEFNYQERNELITAIVYERCGIVEALDSRTD